MNEQTAPAARGKVPTWIRTHQKTTIAIIAAAAVLTAGAVAGGVAIANQSAHDSALAQAHVEVGDLAQAEIRNNARAIELGEALTAATALDVELAAVTAEGAAVFDAAALAAVEEARAELASTAAGVQPAATEEEAGTVPAGEVEFTASVIPVTSSLGAGSVDTAASTEQLDTTAAELGAEAAAIDVDTKTKQQAIDDLAAATVDVGTTLADVAATAKPVSDAVLAAAPSADQPSRDGLAASLGALEALEDPARAELVAPLRAFLAAVAGVKNSHAAVEAQKAIEAAQQADAPTYTDPTTGETRENPRYTGGGNPSGGGPSGGNPGGGDPGGGNPGGGGQPVDNNRYVSTNGSYVGCTDGFVIGTHDPGPGGTSSPGYSFPWGYSISGGVITFYDCG